MPDVLIADDQPDTRRALRTIVEHQPGFRVVGEASDGIEALGQAERRRPDIVLMDIRMSRLDGLAATRAIRTLPTPPAVIVLTTFDLDEYVFGALEAGADGFLLKTASVEEVGDALTTIASGGALISAQVTRRVIERFAATAPARRGDPTLGTLSDREREVLLAVARGRTNTQIAGDLVIELSTVKSHVGRLLDKLRCANRVQLAIYAYETGLITPAGPGR